MNKIMPCLWFDGNAEEAAEFYTSLLKNSKITKVVRNGKSGPGPEGSALTVAFTLAGQEFLGLNGGPMFKFSEAVSFFINCESQEEIDTLWNALTSNGGEESMCGWLKDRFGLSWQIVPAALQNWMTDADPEKAERVMQAVWKMRKLDMAELQAAYEG